jgi:hypothetical protein
MTTKGLTLKLYGTLTQSIQILKALAATSVFRVEQQQQKEFLNAYLFMSSD